ncbi:MAG TPA: hypothetical protein VIE90_19115 [Candidatus Binatia bacterium]|jgi:ElaB/YqjD/DUF883 family membrane-anchored ribosome-binding protein
MEYNENENIHELRSEEARKAERAAERASWASHRTAEKVGDRMKTFAGKIRDTGPRVESKIHDTAERLAERFERGADYFKEGRYQDTGRKLTDYIREHPVTAMAVGIAAGLLLAFKRRH